MNKLQAITKGPPERSDYKLKIRSVWAGSQIIDEIFRELLIIIKQQKGLTELDLARKIRKLAKDKGAQGMAFPPIVSFGKNSAEIHHKPNKTTIGKNNFLMLDYGVKVRDYCSDFTRTLFLGQPNKFQKKIYNLVLNAQLAAIKQIKPGVDCQKIDMTARTVITNAGFGRFFTHSTGHSVGRLIHEPPSFSPISPSVLESSIIMTVEPGIYLPNKFGVRIEDMVLVSKKPKIFSKIHKDFKSMIVKI